MPYTLLIKRLTLTAVAFALLTTDAVAAIDEIAGLVSEAPGARFVKRFAVPASALIVGVELVNNDDRVEYPELSILRGPATRLSEATILANLVDVRATSAHRVRVVVDPIAVRTESEILVAVSFPASSGVRGVGDGAGIGATKLEETSTACFVAPTMDEAFQSIDLDLGITLVYETAAKADIGSRASGSVARDYLLSASPSANVATIQFGLDSTKRVRLSIFDVAGHEVRRLVDGPFAGGVHARNWDGGDKHGAPVAAGVYFAKLTAGSRTLSQKIVLIR